MMFLLFPKLYGASMTAKAIILGFGIGASVAIVCFIIWKNSDAILTRLRSRKSHKPEKERQP